ncbi:hypothetical protein MPTK1_7g17990 [Marchantia polymorpha subsp. ruderalis]|uniref:Amine oxidase domain-containing protein n=2 Tax=Marchantia polymorpha TaxID=3197 RepID=A0A176WD60_MARPO|nr:hypothetical protein AXG93_4201s1120 [Marchantia polymorpha subsp. ruderalis]PTQ32177.1 hypothetical protein MARPO_0102s0041 [Marchantia polymorpha]BBN17915.1 hypothetical protein Mp_7g17990 [Marchantia polymorpha subsp. ruderalis]|eukprot:PTQ32177.1 hypothetical protein MARPO_0102s0041 [Marchantia polymorpha]
MSMELIAKIPLQSSSSFGNACKSVKSAVPGIVAAPQRLHSVEGGNFVGTPKLRSEKAERKRLLSVNAVAVSDRATGRRNVEGIEETDVIVIGSGIGGLCCGGLLARNGDKVLVLESHTIAGGAAHSFEIKGFHFDSGPSLFSGLTSKGMQANPLAQVLDALGESVECVKYDGWMVYVPEGTFYSRIGPSEFLKDLEKFGGPGAVEEWRALQEVVQPLSGAAMALPPAALRGDLGVVLTAFARYAPGLLKSFLRAGAMGGPNKLIGPFSDVVDEVGVKNQFIRNWVDLLSFMLSGLKADATLAAEVVYMFGEWYQPGCTLEYPVGGSAAIVDALVRGLEKHGGRLALGSHVDEILVEGGRAVGVRLRGGKVIKARKAVVTNASMWNTQSLLSKENTPEELRRRAEDTPLCDSFMHLHLGIDAKDLPADLEIHHMIVNDWDIGVDAPQNVVAISIPSVLDPNLAPPGKHCLHAYTPGTEPYDLWKGLDRNSQAYKDLKKERSEVLWKAVERALGPGFSRDKCEVKLEGTPLTHERFLRRAQGTYGPAIRAGQSTFPGHSTPIKGLYCCGDSTFPGIGIPAVAASGLVAANTLTPVWEHIKLLETLGL